MHQEHVCGIHTSTYIGYLSWTQSETKPEITDPPVACTGEVCPRVQPDGTGSRTRKCIK